LAVDMVGRTNVFLELKCDPELIEGNPLRCNDGDPTWRIRGGRTRQELTTRNEVADLGNVHSPWGQIIHPNFKSHASPELRRIRFSQFGRLISHQKVGCWREHRTSAPGW
jgi:hypothetical protein